MASTSVRRKRRVKRIHASRDKISYWLSIRARVSDRELFDLRGHDRASANLLMGPLGYCRDIASCSWLKRAFYPETSAPTIVDAMNQIHAQSKPSPDIWYTSPRIGQLIKQMVSEVAA